VVQGRGVVEMLCGITESAKIGAEYRFV